MNDCDKEILGLLAQWLTAATKLPSGQTLSNIYLHAFDETLNNS